MIRARVLFLVSSLAFALGGMSCIDPVHSDDVAALGGERDGVPTGPTHRPGQPCRVCHGGDGPGKPEFTIAGTVYLARNGGLPAAGTTVVIMASDHNTVLKTVTANEVGNFYITTDDWKPGPTFPLFIRLASADPAVVPKEMQTPIGRNGGCGFCHYGADNQLTHMPPIYLADPPAPTSDAGASNDAAAADANEDAD